VVAVPCSVEELVAESQDQDVLNHLLTEVVVNTEDLLLLPVGIQSLLEVARALKVLAEGLLDLKTIVSICDPTAFAQATYNNTSETALGVAVALELLRNSNENTWRQGHVEDTVGLLSLAALLDLLEVLVQVDKGVILVVLAGNVGAEVAELI
jgi:hypothetical protein